jgi:hypothetical protein
MSLGLFIGMTLAPVRLSPFLASRLSHKLRACPTSRIQNAEALSLGVAASAKQLCGFSRTALPPQSNSFLILSSFPGRRQRRARFNYFKL